MEITTGINQKHYKCPQSALVVVCTSSSQVLVMQRTDDTRFWQSVTGSLEIGESYADAAKRELSEETGLNPSDGILKDQHHFANYPIFTAWRHRYAAEVYYNLEATFIFTIQDNAMDKVIINLREHLQFQWLKKHAAIARVTSPSNKQAIELYVP